MKTHLNLATTDLAKSVAFYSTLLNVRPAKTLADYALFITECPGLELALDLRAHVQAADDVHYGIFVETAGEVDGAIQRLSAAGLAGTIEREDTCCYANQTKVWATDPEGRRWEVYTVHEDTEARDTPETTCCTSDGEETRSCCAALA
jgi:catechol 2,3-dioxygenase-like lactoylglutathione lyase family enzyme